MQNYVICKCSILSYRILCRGYQRDEDEYEREDYDEYEEDDSGGEQEVEEEIEEPPSQEQQEFLKLREQLKEKYRKQLKNEASSAFGRSQLQDKKKTTANDR